jgi:hypothetical protein
MHSVRLTILLTAAILATAAGAGAVAYMGLWPFRQEVSPALSVTIAGNPIQLDRTYLLGSRPGHAESTQLDLVAVFPDFRPARSRNADELSGERTSMIFIKLSAPDDAVEPADRPSKLYARFLEPEAWSHPGGLVMRRFEKDSPYEGEELFIAPPDGRTFFARCPRPKQDGLPVSCISEFRQAGLEVRLRFAPELLPAWQQMIDGARGLVRSILRNP